MKRLCALVLMLPVVGMMGCRTPHYTAVAAGVWPDDNRPEVYFFKDGETLPSCYVGRGLAGKWYESHDLYSLDSGPFSTDAPSWQSAFTEAEKHCPDEAQP